MKVTTPELIRIIQQHVDWIEANALADYFGVTSRTIRKRIKEINGIYPNLIVSSYKGYKVNESSYTEELYDNEDELSSRAEFIIRKLIVANSPLSIYDLADEMHISDSSFERALKLVKSIIIPFELEIERKRYRITITGKERRKRSLINYLISKENEGSFFADCAFTSEFISKEVDINMMSGSVKKIFDDNSVYINDYGLNTVLFHILIMLERVTSGLVVNDESTISVNTDAPVVRDVVNWLSSQFNIELSPVEVKYLAIIILNNSNQGEEYAINKHNIQDYIEREYIELAKKLCNDLAANYCLDPFDDEFIVNLTIHLRNLINRIKSETFTHNPLAVNFKNQFPLIYDMAAFVVQGLSEYLNSHITDDEIAFIAFHLGSYLENKKANKDRISVCYVYSGYHNFHLNTIAQISKEFESDIYISSVLSINEFASLKSGIDMLITSCNIESALPVVHTGVFLTEADRQNIRTTIDLIKLNRRKEKLRKDLNAFMHRDLFKKEFYCEDNTEMIRILADECVKMGLCDSNYAQEVLEREKLTSTSFRNGIAIPHSLKANARHSFMSIVANKKKMLWGTNYVNLIVMMGTSVTDRVRFQNVYNQLVQILYEPANVRILIGSTDYDDFLDKIINLIP